MAYRQVDGIDTHDFPDDLLGHPLIGWMGDDYVQFIASELQRRFREQDAGSDLIAMKCEAFPIIETSALEDGTVRAVVTVFSLQLLIRASHGNHWRIRGGGMFRAEKLDQPGATS